MKEFLSLAPLLLVVFMVVGKTELSDTKTTLKRPSSIHLLPESRRLLLACEKLNEACKPGSCK